MMMQDGSFYLQWHITNRCNNRCPQCYQKTYTGTDVTLAQADLVLASLVECYAELEVQPRIGITGGDPFLNKHVYSIVQKSCAVSRDVLILANPEHIVMHPDDARRLKDMGVSGFQLSLDGNQSTHDALRSTGSYNRTLTALRILADAGIRVSVMSTVSPVNVADMHDVMHTAYAHGAACWTFMRWVPDNQTATLISAQEYADFLLAIDQAHQRYEMQGMQPQTKEPLLAINRRQEYDKVSGCGLGFSQLTLLPDNTVMGCRRHPGSVLGMLSEQRTLLWHFAMNPAMDEFRDFHRIDGCKNCELVSACRGCRAIAFVTQGDTFGIDPQCPKIQGKGGSRS